MGDGPTNMTRWNSGLRSPEYIRNVPPRKFVTASDAFKKTYFTNGNPTSSRGRSIISINRNAPRNTILADVRSARSREPQQEQQRAGLA
eukprot:1628096-Pleurochrysis_carterae.AAC.1